MMEEGRRNGGGRKEGGRKSSSTTSFRDVNTLLFCKLGVIAKFL
jgi:hypothetical protein